MDPITIALLAIVALFVTILLGVHIGFALLVISVAGMGALTGRPETAVRLLGSTAFEAVRDYVFAVIPLFVLMGAFMSHSRAAAALYAAAHLFLRKLAGGLAIATVLANAAFAAVTGVSVASAAVFARISLPEMQRHGYQLRFALGSIAGSSVLGMLIPPSLLFILYGILSQVSIGSLFLAGIVPGLLLTLMYAIGIVVMVKLNPGLVNANGASAQGVHGAEAAAGSEQQAPPGGIAAGGEQQAPTGASEGPMEMSGGKALLAAVPVFILLALVLGGIWLGWYTPTEAAAIGAIGALIIGVFLGMRTAGAWDSLLSTARTTGSIMLLLVAASAYSRMLATTGFVDWLETTITPFLVSPTLIIVLAVIMVGLLGAILDSSSILLLTVPLFLPVITAAGIDPLYFGVILVVAVEVGLLTPPFGMVPFAMSAVLGESVKSEDIFAGAIPYVGIMILLIAILIAFPGLSTWLPNLLGF